jgi:hypothetical protein
LNFEQRARAKGITMHGGQVMLKAIERAASTIFFLAGSGGRRFGKRWPKRRRAGAKIPNTSAAAKAVAVAMAAGYKVTNGRRLSCFTPPPGH